MWDGISKTRLIKPGNSETEERATAHLKIISKNNKDENSKDNFNSVCVNAYAGNMLYSK